MSASPNARDHAAIVEWLPAEERGTTRLPHGLRYVGIGKFESDGPAWPEGAHRVVCRFAVPPSEGTSGKSEVRVSFLVDDAPHDRLVAGARFQLFEGPTAVATVEVLW